MAIHSLNSHTLHLQVRLAPFFLLLSQLSSAPCRTQAQQIPLHCMQTRWASARELFTVILLKFRTYGNLEPWWTIVNRSPDRKFRIDIYHDVLLPPAQLWFVFSSHHTARRKFLRKMRFRIDIQKALSWSRGVESRGTPFLP
jgi:hypothetical protein